jgi:hypothetical protein
MFNCIKDYISFRSARVKVDGIQSNKVYISHIVSQCGHCSPTLFLINMNDVINELPPHTYSVLHAVDLAIWHASENIETANQNIHESLNAISLWTNNMGVKRKLFRLRLQYSPCQTQ